MKPNGCKNVRIHSVIPGIVFFIWCISTSVNAQNSIYSEPFLISTDTNMISTMAASALDKNGKLHIAFVGWYAQTGAPDGVASEIFYSNNVGGTFSTPQKLPKAQLPFSANFEDDFYYSKEPSIAVDAGGKVHVAYYRTDIQLSGSSYVCYTTNRSGTFSVPKVIYYDSLNTYTKYGNLGNHIMVAADPRNDSIHIIFDGNQGTGHGGVRYTSGLNGKFKVPVTYCRNSEKGTIKFDSQGIPHILYWLRSDTTNLFSNLNLVTSKVINGRYTAPVIQFESANTFSGENSFAFDKYDSIHAVFRNTEFVVGSYDMRFFSAKNNGHTLVRSMPTNTSVSLMYGIEVGNDNTKYIAYKQAAGLQSLGFLINDGNGFRDISPTDYNKYGFASATPQWFTFDKEKKTANFVYTTGLIWLVTANLETPAKPVCISPADNAVNVSMPPILKWKKSSGASSYELQVAISSSFSQLIKNQADITDTIFSCSGLTSGIPYYWRVRASNSMGLSAWSDTLLFTPKSDTQAPTIQASNIVLTAITKNSASFRWTKGNGSMSAVFVKQDTQGVVAPVDNTTYVDSVKFLAGTQVSSSGWYCIYKGTDSLAVISGLSQTSSYRIMVISFNGSSGDEKYLKVSASGNPTNFTTTCDLDFYGTNPPVHFYYKTPTTWDMEFSFTHSCGSIKFTFNDRMLTGNSVSLNVNAYPNTGTIQGTLSADGTSITGTYNINFAYLHPIYGYSVSCGNKSGSWSATASASKPAIASAISGDSIVVAGTIKNYQVPLTAGITYTWNATGGTVAASGNTASVTWNSPGSQILTVSPSNSCGTGTARILHVTVNAIPQVETPVLTGPGINSVNQPLSLILVWANLAGVTGYDLQVSTKADFSILSVNQAGLTSNSFAISGLSPGTKYFWKVRAFNGSTYGNWSSPWNFTTFTDTKTPTVQAHNVSVFSITANSAMIRWTKGNGTQSAVFVKLGTDGVAAPVDNFTYLDSSKFMAGTQIGISGWYCAYTGTDSLFTLSGLTPQSDFRVMVISYNGMPGDEKYLRVSATGNPSSFRTICDKDLYGTDPVVRLYYKSPLTYDVEITLTHSCGTSTFKFLDRTISNNSLNISVNVYPNTGNMQGTLSADGKTLSGTYNINFAYLHPIYGYSVSCGNRTGSWSAVSNPCSPPVHAEAITENQFNFFPNPVNQFLNIRGSELEKGSLFIYSYEGRMIRQYPENIPETIDVANFPDGIYLIKFSTPDVLISKLFVKHKM